MRRVWIILPAGLLALVVGMGLANRAWADDENEQQVTLDQVPEAVKATILKEAGDHPITEIEKEVRDGKTYYEAEWMADGKEVEIKVAEDGTLLKKTIEDPDDDD